MRLDETAENPLLIDIHGSVHPLEHQHYDVFFISIEEIPIPIIFRTGVKGDITSVDIQMEMSLPEMISYARVPEPEKADEAEGE